jgi:hypothetical protein
VQHTYFNLRKGTYQFTMSSAKAGTNLEVRYAPSEFTASSGVTYYAGDYGADESGNYDNGVYCRIKVAKTGYLRVMMTPLFGADSGENYYVNLCTSGKKDLTKPEMMLSGNKYTTYFGVKKGTYYVKCSGSQDPVFKVNIKSYAVKTSKCGSGKRNAVSLKRNKSVKGVLAASSRRSDWYKITLKKSRRVQLSVFTRAGEGGFLGGIQVQVTRGRRRYTSGTYNRTSSSGSFVPDLYYTSGKKLPKGTYYIRVSRAGTDDDIGNGYYKLTWR